jgi:hypothetical protein
MSITPPEGMCFIPLGIQHAMHMRHIIIGGLFRSAVFVHITS